MDKYRASFAVPITFRNFVFEFTSMAGLMNTYIAQRTYDDLVIFKTIVFKAGITLNVLIDLIFFYLNFEIRIFFEILLIFFLFPLLF